MPVESFFFIDAGSKLGTFLYFSMYACSITIIAVIDEGSMARILLVGTAQRSDLWTFLLGTQKRPPPALCYFERPSSSAEPFERLQFVHSFVR